MSWSTSRPAPIVKPGWTTDPTLPPRTSSQEWAVLLTLGPTNLTVECVTDSGLSGPSLWPATCPCYQSCKSR